MITKRFIHRKNNNYSLSGSFVRRNMIFVSEENRPGELHYISRSQLWRALIITYNRIAGRVGSSSACYTSMYPVITDMVVHDDVSLRAMCPRHASSSRHINTDRLAQSPIKKA
jgi:hypothetical protein